MELDSRLGTETSTMTSASEHCYAVWWDLPGDDFERKVFDDLDSALEFIRENEGILKNMDLLQVKEKNRFQGVGIHCCIGCGTIIGNYGQVRTICKICHALPKYKDIDIWDDPDAEPIPKQRHYRIKCADGQSVVIEDVVEAIKFMKENNIIFSGDNIEVINIY